MLQHHQLAVGEVGNALCLAGTKVLPVHRTEGDFGVVGEARQHGTHGLAQFVQIIGLGHIASRPRLQAAQRIGLGQLRGQHHDLARLAERLDPADHLQAIQARHGDIENHQVRYQLTYQAHGVDAIVRLADHLHTLLTQQHADGGANEGVVVDYQGCVHGAPRSG
ncbi:hypothetical protein D3C80_1609990 [compost metagenome]